MGTGSRGLFREHYKLMYRAANTVIDCPSQAEDVVQNLFLKFVQRPLRPEVRKNPKGYLFRAAFHEALNIRRSRKCRKETPGLEKLKIAEPGTGRANDNARDHLQEMLGKLKPHVVEILILHCEHGYSDTEIAEMLGEKRGKI